MAWWKAQRERLTPCEGNTQIVQRFLRLEMPVAYSQPDRMRQLSA